MQVTEASNPLSEALDLATPVQALHIIHRCEMEIFGGPLGKGVYDDRFLERAKDFAHRLQRRPDLPVLLAGAGTSGRLCRLLALEPPDPQRILRSVLPGGTPALARAKPLGEDHDDDGAEAADALLRSAPDGCFAIGVTCGLTAQYVQGFIDRARSGRHGGATAMLGFNPAATARIELFEDDPDHCLLNPIVGPEAVRGSVRMKGGTATLALLRAVLGSGADNIVHRLEEVECALSKLATLHDFAAEVATACAASIMQGGRVVIVGRSAFGALALFDAAECVPTFSADPNTCRGFVGGGWDYLEGDASDASIPSVDVSLVYYLARVAPTLGTQDTVIVLASGPGDGSADLISASVSAGARFVIDVHGLSDEVPQTVRRSGSLAAKGWPAMIALRSLLGRISTTAFSATGSLYGNRMIDLRITNRKLLRRATDLVAELAGVASDHALDAIVRANGGGVRTPRSGDETDTFILSAAGSTRLVPRALLLLDDPGLDPAGAKQISESVGAIRRVLSKH